MKKFILLLPKPILTKYVLEHFSELSVEDFYEVFKKIKIPNSYFNKNNELSENSNVLSTMLDIEPTVFRNFKPKALTIECVNKIANSGIEVYLSDIEDYPQLLNNNKILENIIKSFPSVIKKVSSEQIDDKVISLLEKSFYTPDEEDIEKKPILLKSKALLERAIEKNPSLILKVDDLSDKIVMTALNSGFVPKKEDFYSNPQLKKFNILLLKAFQIDPSIIVFFDKNDLTEQNTMSAYNRGFIAEEKDLIENPNLCDIHYIMEQAIEKNPRLITLVTARCYISQDLITKTLEKYKITKDDIEKNPELAKNPAIITCLPEFESYSVFITYERKRELIVNCIKNGQPLTIEELPFLDYKFGAKADIVKLSELFDCLKITINETNSNIQQRYFQILDKVIDGIVNIRYIKNKFSFQYPDIVSLHDLMIKIYNNTLKNQNYDLIINFINDLHHFIGQSYPIEEIKREIDRYYTIYQQTGIIDLSLTSEFCNKMLNLQRDNFMSKQKREILGQIFSELELSEKKKRVVINNLKIHKITEIIKKGDFQQFGITEEQLDNLINQTKNIILTNKDIKKIGIDIKESNIEDLIEVFKRNGSLTIGMVNQFLNVNNLEVAQFIVSKFEQIKFRLVNNISLSKEEMQMFEQQKVRMGSLSPTDYLIASEERCLNNIAELLLKLDDEKLSKILENKDLIAEVIYLLPLLNLTQELDSDTFINIISEYARIRDKISVTTNTEENISYTDLTLKKIDDVICLANAYNSIDDITLCALGRNIVSKVGEQDSKEYLTIFLKMLMRESGNIPPISLKTPNYHFESGIYYDPERLLIGKNSSRKGGYSCIDLNDAGEEAYIEALSQNSGDVILVRDNQNNVVSRILLYRRGNVVQMVTRTGEIFPIDIYKEIADQIIKQSISNNDNIEYVFVNNNSSGLANDTFSIIENRKFVYEFPHADFNHSAILLSSKSKICGYIENEVNLRFDERPKCSYICPRKKISLQPTETEITRLRALSIVLESDPIEKENKSRLFQPFYMSEYKKVICGEDWYMALKKDGTIEEIVLPTNDPRVHDEATKFKEELFSDINEKNLL